MDSWLSAQKLSKESVFSSYVPSKEKEFQTNLIFVFMRKNRWTHCRYLERLGCNILSMCSDCSLIVMDELGPHEADATLFRKNPKPFDGQTHFSIAGTCRIFWPEIVNHPKVEIITISEDNRNDRALLNYIQCKISSPNDYSRGYSSELTKGSSSLVK